MNKGSIGSVGGRLCQLRKSDGQKHHKPEGAILLLRHCSVQLRLSVAAGLQLGIAYYVMTLDTESEVKCGRQR